jgi:hypothetical protein
MTPGIQVIEGTTLSIAPAISDDVQVRNVELLVDGLVVRNDVSFPFDLTVSALSTDPVNGTLTVEVRATDTGGNSSISAPLVMELVPDTIAPILVEVTPEDGALLSQGPAAVRVTFSEPIAADVIDVLAVTLRRAADPAQLFEPIDIQLRSGDTVVQFSYASLPPGSYQLTVDAAGVTDRAGNAVVAAPTSNQFGVISQITSVAAHAWPNERPAEQGNPPPLAVDGDISTFTWSTAAFNTINPPYLGLYFDAAHEVQRIRLWKDEHGGGGSNFKDLVIQYTTDATPSLETGTWQNVTGLMNGFQGSELLSAGAVNTDGTVVHDVHNSLQSGWASLSFDPVMATGVRIGFSGTSFLHYRVYELQAWGPEVVALSAAYPRSTLPLALEVPFFDWDTQQKAMLKTVTQAVLREQDLELSVPEERQTLALFVRDEERWNFVPPFRRLNGLPESLVESAIRDQSPSDRVFEEAFAEFGMRDVTRPLAHSGR